MNVIFQERKVSWKNKWEIKKDFSKPFWNQKQISSSVWEPIIVSWGEPGGKKSAMSIE